MTTYIIWDDYFMAIALMSSLRSKDPNTKHGAVIINNECKIISTGYNGFVSIPDNDNIFPWTKDNKEWNKYQFVVHAECNAILNANSNLKNCILYLYSDKNYLPCQECIKMIIQSGITEIVVVDIIDTNTDVYNWKPVLYMIEKANIKIRTLKDFSIKKILSL